MFDLRLVRSAGLSLLVASCVVPAARYDEARSALAVEREGHRRTHVRMYALQKQVAALRGRLADRERQIVDRDRLLSEHAKLLAESELELAVAGQDKESANEIVRQLQGELERTGDHLKVFAEQKLELQKQLEAARLRAEHLAEVERSAAARALMMRDLSLALHDSIAKGEVRFDLHDGTPVLRMPVDRVFVDGADEIHPDARGVLAALARVVLQTDGTKLEVTENDSDGTRGISDDLMLRLERLNQALIAEGVPAGRVSVAVPTESEHVAADGAKHDSGGEGPAFVEILLSTKSG